MSLDGHLCLPVSKTFVRSMKAAKSGCHCSLHFCYSCRRENTISMVDLLARETHCNSGYSLRQNLEPLQCYSGEKLLNDGKERDATVVIVVTFIAFVLVECDDVLVLHPLFNRDRISYNSRDDVSFAALQDFGKDSVFFRCLARGKGVESLV